MIWNFVILEILILHLTKQQHLPPSLCRSHFGNEFKPPPLVCYPSCQPSTVPSIKQRIRMGRGQEYRGRMAQNQPVFERQPVLFVVPFLWCLASGAQTLHSNVCGNGNTLRTLCPYWCYRNCAPAPVLPLRRCVLMDESLKFFVRKMGIK